MLAQSVTILGVDTPEMKIEPLLQIQENMLAKSLSLKRCLVTNPKKTRKPLVAGDHPENDLSDFCDQDQIKEPTNFAFWTGEI